MKKVEILLGAFVAVIAFSQLGAASKKDIRQIELTQAKSRDESRHVAKRTGADVFIRLQVVDDKGETVPGSNVGVGFFNGSKDNVPDLKGLTGDDGTFEITGRCRYWIRVHVFKKGYYAYDEKLNVSWTDSIPAVIDGKWQPWGEERRIVLKRKLNPVAMGNHRFGRYKPPAFDEWLGFDLCKCLWCSPYGEGEHADVLMRFTKDYHSPFDFASTFEVSFTNNPCAGFALLRKDMCSEMKSIHTASTNDSTYSETYFKQVKRVVEHGTSREDRLPDDEYLVFRTRTKVDDEGRLLSAHYGKIYGPFEYNVNFVMESRGVYFNPTANDPNLEDDVTYKESEVYFNQRLPHK